MSTAPTAAGSAGPAGPAAIDYDGRNFRRAGGGDGVVVHYRQEGNLVWADFTGGPVRRGTLNGTCVEDGTLSLAYSMVMATGELISGHTVNTPAPGADGLLLLREEWQRYGNHSESGVSYLEEVHPDVTD